MNHPTYQPLAYAETDGPVLMRHDARCVEVSILLRSTRSTGRSTGRSPGSAAARPAYQDKVKRLISVDDAARRLAATLHLD